MKNKKGFWIQAKNKSAEIYIYETIGDGWLGGISAKSFAKELKDLGKVDDIEVFISSDGGSVFDGVSIYNQLKRHRARVITNIDGIAASIASVIAMAGDEVYMAENAQMMIHKAWTVTSGNADELRKQADILDQIDEDTIVKTYANRSGMDEGEISSLMSDETWMSSDEAKEYGFIDGITAEVKMAAYYDLSKFKNVPAKLTEAMQAMLDPDRPLFDARREKIAKMNVSLKKMKL